MCPALAVRGTGRHGAVFRVEARRRHVRGADGLDLNDVAKARLLEQRVVIGDDFVEESETLESLVVHRLLRVEVGEVGHRREHHAHRVVGLGVQFLVLFVAAQKVDGHVRRQNVVNQLLVALSHVAHQFFLLLDFLLPQEQSPRYQLELRHESETKANS